MFDYSQEWHRDTRSKRRENSVWNCLTVLVTFAILPVVFISLVIYMYPYSSFNPFPPPSEDLFPVNPPLSMPGQLTNAPTPFQPGYATDVAVTLVPLPTITLPATDAQVIQPTSEPVAVEYLYAIQNAPDSIDTTLINPTRTDCKWLGVGGQVLTIDKRPKTDISVEMGGNLGGKEIKLTSLSGTSIQYGPAGYEFTLSDAPAASIQTVWIRLVNKDGTPLSERTYLNTYESCEKNLTIVNFIGLKQ